VLVNHRAVAAEVLVNGDAVVREPKQPGEPALAVLDRSSGSNAQSIARVLAA
jgi:hypothetical protein